MCVCRGMRAHTRLDTPKRFAHSCTSYNGRTWNNKWFSFYFNFICAALSIDIYIPFSILYLLILCSLFCYTHTSHTNIGHTHTHTNIVVCSVCVFFEFFLLFFFSFYFARCVSLNSTIKMRIYGRWDAHKRIEISSIGCDREPPPSSWIRERKWNKTNGSSPYGCGTIARDRWRQRLGERSLRILTHTHIAQRIKFKMRMPDAFVILFYFILLLLNALVFVFIWKCLGESYNTAHTVCVCSSFWAQKMNCFQVQRDPNRRNIHTKIIIKRKKSEKKKTKTI